MVSSEQVIASPENGVWDFSAKGWAQLFGSFPLQGISVEWHDFETSHDIPWDKSFHDESLEICLNLQGTGEVSRRGKSGIQFREQTVGFYSSRKDRLRAIREKNEKHSFLTIEISKKYLKDSLRNQTEGLIPLAQAFLTAHDQSQVCSQTLPLSSALQSFVADLRNPQVPRPARNLWYRSKTIEAISSLLFEETRDEELFCTRQKRLAKERVEKIKLLLKQNLEQPLRLGELGKIIGCSSFYLSRTFSQETGTSIPKYLRQLRIERAAELLKSGEYNVTETALQVGYASPSHFTKAFHEILGCCPGLYPIKSLQK